MSLNNTLKISSVGNINLYYIPYFVGRCHCSVENMEPLTKVKKLQGFDETLQLMYMCAFSPADCTSSHKHDEDNALC